MDRNLIQLFELVTLLTSSRPPKNVEFEAVFVHARSFQNDDEGLFELVAELISSNQPVVINGGDGRGVNPTQKAWPGADEYEGRLKSIGITNIIRSEPARHTQEEGAVFADIIKQSGWREVIVANLPHYLPRIMLSFVKDLEKLGISWVKLYPVATTSLNWRRRVSGTQGRDETERLLQCGEELQRVFDYPITYPGKFVTIPQLIDYLSNLNAS